MWCGNVSSIFSMALNFAIYCRKILFGVFGYAACWKNSGNSRRSFRKHLWTMSNDSFALNDPASALMISHSLIFRPFLIFILEVLRMRQMQYLSHGVEFEIIIFLLLKYSGLWALDFIRSYFSSFYSWSKVNFDRNFYSGMRYAWKESMSFSLCCLGEQTAFCSQLTIEHSVRYFIASYFNMAVKFLLYIMAAHKCINCDEEKRSERVVTYSLFQLSILSRFR